MGHFSVETRQKAGVLFETSALQKAGASAGLGPAEVDGYASISVLVLSDQPFTVSLFEALVPGGPFVLSQAYTSTSSGSAGPGFMVAQRFSVTGSFLKATIQNTGSDEKVLSAKFLGIPLP